MAPPTLPLNELPRAIRLRRNGQKIISELLTDEDIGFQSISVFLQLYNRINNPTNSAPAAGVAGGWIAKIPFTALKSLAASWTLEIELNDPLTIFTPGPGAIWDMRNQVSVTYGFCQEFIRFSTIIDHTENDLMLAPPSELGNAKSVILISNEPGLVSPFTYYTWTDEKGRSLVNPMSGAELCAMTEDYLGFGYWGILQGLYCIRIPVPLLSAKSDNYLKIKTDADEELDDGLIAYWEHSYAIQTIKKLAEFNYSPKEIDLGEHDQKDVDIIEYMGLKEQMDRVNSKVALPSGIVTPSANKDVVG